VRRALLLLALLAAVPAQAHDPPAYALRAGEVHLGDGRVLRDALVLVRHDRVAGVGLKSAPPGVPVREVPVVMPGLVAARMAAIPAGADDPEAMAPGRRALDAWDPFARHDRLVAAGVTSAYLVPGERRLVPGRGALVRLAGPPDERVLVGEGALHAVVGDPSKNPPILFEPPVPASPEKPFEPAEPQPAVTRMGEWRELRDALAGAAAGRPSHPAWREVVRRQVPLRVLAHQERDVRAAARLAEEFHIRLVVEGGAEAWKAAADLARAKAGVVLTVAAPGAAPASVGGPGTEARLDAPGILAAAGVDVALAPAGEAGLHHLLDLAAAGVRGGLTEGAALAAVTSVPARLAGGDVCVGLIEAGCRADLLVLSAPPLSPGAAPREVIVAGTTVWREEAATTALLAVRVGVLLTGAGERHAPGLVVMEGDRVLLAGAGPVPWGARVLEFPEGVAVPGFIDAFGRAGTEVLAGASPPGGSAALTAADAVAPGGPGLEGAVRGGVTAVHLYPQTRGPVRGTTSLVRVAKEKGLPVVQKREVGILFHVDGGPEAGGSRARTLHALEGLLKRAKGYHEKRTQKGKGARKLSQGPDEDLDMEALRPMFRGEVRALVRAGRADAVLNAVEVFAGHGIKPVVVGGEEADRVADRIAGKVEGVILGPEVLARREGKWVNRPAVLLEAGVPVLFGSFDGAGAEGLGLAAAFAVRHGLGSDEALQALTGGAGAVLGLGDGPRPGLLERGGPADLAVWSGDPFEATSRLLLVVAGGEVAWPPDLTERGEEREAR